MDNSSIGRVDSVKTESIISIESNYAGEANENVNVPIDDSSDINPTPPTTFLQKISNFFRYYLNGFSYVSKYANCSFFDKLSFIFFQSTRNRVALEELKNDPYKLYDFDAFTITDVQVMKDICSELMETRHSLEILLSRIDYIPLPPAEKYQVLKQAFDHDSVKSINLYQITHDTLLGLNDAEKLETLKILTKKVDIETAVYFILSNLNEISFKSTTGLCDFLFDLELSGDIKINKSELRCHLPEYIPPFLEHQNDIGKSSTTNMGDHAFAEFIDWVKSYKGSFKTILTHTEQLDQKGKLSLTQKSEVVKELFSNDSLDCFHSGNIERIMSSKLLDQLDVKKLLLISFTQQVKGPPLLPSSISNILKQIDDFEFVQKLIEESTITNQLALVSCLLSEKADLVNQESAFSLVNSSLCRAYTAMDKLLESIKYDIGNYQSFNTTPKARELHTLSDAVIEFTHSECLKTLLRGEKSSSKYQQFSVKERVSIARKILASGSIDLFIDGITSSDSYSFDSHTDKKHCLLDILSLESELLTFAKTLQDQPNEKFLKFLLILGSSQQDLKRLTSNYLNIPNHTSDIQLEIDSFIEKYPHVAIRLITLLDNRDLRVINYSKTHLPFGDSHGFPKGLSYETYLYDVRDSLVENKAYIMRLMADKAYDSDFQIEFSSYVSAFKFCKNVLQANEIGDDATLGILMNTLRGLKHDWKCGEELSKLELSGNELEILLPMIIQQNPGFAITNLFDINNLMQSLEYYSTASRPEGFHTDYWDLIQSDDFRHQQITFGPKGPLPKYSSLEAPLPVGAELAPLFDLVQAYDRFVSKGFVSYNDSIRRGLLNYIDNINNKTISGLSAGKTQIYKIIRREAQSIIAGLKSLEHCEKTSTEKKSTLSRSIFTTISNFSDYCVGPYIKEPIKLVMTLSDYLPENESLRNLKKLKDSPVDALEEFTKQAVSKFQLSIVDIIFPSLDPSPNDTIMETHRHNEFSVWLDRKLLKIDIDHEMLDADIYMNTNATYDRDTVLEKLLPKYNKYELIDYLREELERNYLADENDREILEDYLLSQPKLLSEDAKKAQLLNKKIADCEQAFIRNPNVLKSRKHQDATKELLATIKGAFESIPSSETVGAKQQEFVNKIKTLTSKELLELGLITLEDIKTIKASSDTDISTLYDLEKTATDSLSHLQGLLKKEDCIAIQNLTDDNVRELEALEIKPYNNTMVKALIKRLRNAAPGQESSSLQALKNMRHMFPQSIKEMSKSYFDAMGARVKARAEIVEGSYDLIKLIAKASGQFSSEEELEEFGEVIEDKGIAFDLLEAIFINKDLDVPTSHISMSNLSRFTEKLINEVKDSLKASARSLAYQGALVLEPSQDKNGDPTQKQRINRKVVFEILKKTGYLSDSRVRPGFGERAMGAINNALARFGQIF